MKSKIMILALSFTIAFILFVNIANAICNKCVSNIPCYGGQVGDCIHDFSHSMLDPDSRRITGIYNADQCISGSDPNSTCSYPQPFTWVPCYDYLFYYETEYCEGTPSYSATAYAPEGYGTDCDLNDPNMP